MSIYYTGSIGPYDDRVDMRACGCKIVTRCDGYTMYCCDSHNPFFTVTGTNSDSEDKPSHSYKEVRNRFKNHPGMR